MTHSFVVGDHVRYTNPHSAWYRRTGTVVRQTNEHGLAAVRMTGMRGELMVLDRDLELLDVVPLLSPADFGR